ncbi:MAG: isoleucine--tRNA ligase [Verrucomicrobiales bacterium]
MSQPPSTGASPAETYKHTVLLPRTEFPMRADLVKREPARLEKWERSRLYDRIQARRRAQGAPRFVLHDGPPFANGDVHMGTALNKILKDLVLKARTMAGFETPYVPGWDCHGLPIEFKVVKEAAGLSPAEVRTRAEAFARQFIDIQRTSFRRLGVFGDWQNPYLTLDRAYEADIIRVFAICVEKGLVYQSQRPVLWSYGAQTALAEAEVEYKEKSSPAIFVAFPGLGVDFHYVIWTTTPWTLPSNLGIALHPEFEYVVGAFSREGSPAGQFLVAASLLEEFQRKTGLQLDREVRRAKGAALAGGQAQHPFLPRTSQVITGLFVTAETGTGAVHIAPGHGADDYNAGRDHGLGLLSPVDDLGRFTAEVGLDFLVGQHVFDANEPIITRLRESGALLAREKYVHQYPHCWRSKTPIIFRSVPQFFIRIDDVRQRALQAIDEVEWIPSWGRNRIYGTVEARPDWCISRQRAWGVPLPVFYDRDGQPILSAEVARRVADVVAELGTNAWFEKSDAEWAALAGLPDTVTRGRDTLDVWIDSGSSHVAVLGRRPELGEAPADLYLEATDQHRGWFQSSLMLGVIVRGAAPYRRVLTHGFVIDNSTGEKISKSGDKPINAEFFYNKFGADLVRLWAASVDYREEVPFSLELFDQTTDAYRRIRNTLRILLGNLHGFDPARHAVPNDQLTLVDRWALERLHAVVRECRTAYDALEFRRVFIALNQFCAVDLSALYVDLLKDRMYCDAENSPRRRSAQTAIHAVFSALCRLFAPILAFTADEAWENAGHTDSVHLEDFPDPDPAFETATSTPVVDALLLARESIQREVEKLRQAKLVGSNNEAAVTLHIPADHRLASLLDDAATVAEFLIVSDLTLVPAAAGGELRVQAALTSLPKCERCWRHLPNVGTCAAHPVLCRRCAEVVLAAP